jgi:hypothetical protein
MIYLYYPFDDGTGIETLDGLVRGVGNKIAPKGAVQSPKIGELFCDNGTTPGGFWSVANGDEIYVMGHTYLGMKVLGDANKKTIDQSEIVSRLERCGLKKNVTCKIVMYACYSSRSENNSPGLAAFVASSLKTNDFACYNNVYGFRRPVGMKAGKGAGGQYELILESSPKNWVLFSAVESWAIEKVDPHI